VYDTSAFAHWAEVLGRDDLVPGIFGENFTVEGMPDDEVCVGDTRRPDHRVKARMSRSAARG